MAIATAWLVEFDGYDKVVCTRARLLREVENPFNENNVGKNNSGNNNSGDWNSGNRNSGYFCTGYRHGKIFNKPIPEDWKPRFPKWIYFELLPDGYYGSWQKAFENSDVEGIKELLALPNFDYKIFEKITSITKKQIKKRL